MIVQRLPPLPPRLHKAVLVLWTLCGIVCAGILVCVVFYYAFAIPLPTQASIIWEEVENRICFDAVPSPLKRDLEAKASYKSLNEDEQRTYRKLYQALWLQRDDVSFAGVDKEHLWDIYMRLRYDSPELFFITEVFRTTTTTIDTVTTNHVVLFEPFYTDDIVRVREMREQIVKIITPILSKVAELHDEKVQARELHDWLCNIVTYKEWDDRGHNAYDALCCGRSVCEGYALAYGLLCDQAGLINRVIVGRMEFVADPMVAHAWNAVMCEGDEFYIDVTFDDKPTLSYRYFFKDRSFMDGCGYIPYGNNMLPFEMERV